MQQIGKEIAAEEVLSGQASESDATGDHYGFVRQKSFRERQFEGMTQKEIDNNFAKHIKHKKVEYEKQLVENYMSSMSLQKLIKQKKIQ